ncbi:hypothetical protein F7725_001707 [Dissostichus mawsoni]|uniref:Uncharacterized protein n=1 Tax=Dissostichus mawsoni TaxID=36200 RepID=A0A7J5Y3D8_DISMA|nr:hypothetical protein F7725_001707 [Dissostichus mawsoni]
MIHATISDHGQRITSLESNADLVDGRLSTLEATCAELAASNAELRAKTADLEARSRRKNIRIIGLPESIEGPRPTAFFSDLLPQLLGDQILPTSPELVRAHRTLAAKPRPGERPRPVIIRFHNFQTKERVIREARKMRADLRYEGKPIAFYEDYIPEVVMQRALYRQVMAQLYKLGLRPALQYPAKLMITTENGEKVWLSSVEEAKKYLAAKQRRLILLKWIHSSPPTHNRWIHEILYCVRLERIRFSLRDSLTTFHNTWQPFLDHIDTLTIDEEPNT